MDSYVFQKGSDSIELNDGHAATVFPEVNIAWANPTEAYNQWVADGNHEWAYPGSMHENPEHTIPVTLYADTSVGLKNLVHKVKRIVSTGARFFYRMAGSEIGMWTNVLTVRSEQSKELFDPSGRKFMEMTLSVTCDYWHGTFRNEEHDITFPAEVEVEIGGEGKALVGIKMSADPATKGMAIGLKHEAEEGFVSLNNYEGTADANAMDGEAATETSLPDTWTPVGSAPLLPVAPNRGEVMVLARVKSTQSGVRWRARSIAFGSGVMESVEETSDPVSASTGYSNFYEMIALGPLSIPVSDIPTASGGVWGAEQTLASQSFMESIELQYVQLDMTSAFAQTISQPWRAGGFTFSFTGARSDDWVTFVRVDVFKAVGDIPGEHVGFGEVQMVQTASPYDQYDYTVNLYDIPSGTPLALEPGNYIYVVKPVGVIGHESSRFYIGHNNLFNDFAGGKSRKCNPGGVWSDLPHDLKFELRGKISLSSDVSVQIEALRPTANVWLDHVILLPCTCGSILSTHDGETTEGMYANLLDPRPGQANVYVYANDDGVEGYGSSILPDIEWPGGMLMLLPPGRNTLVATIDTADFQPQPTGKLLLTIIERWTQPFGGTLEPEEPEEEVPAD